MLRRYVPSTNQYDTDGSIMRVKYEISIALRNKFLFWLNNQVIRYVNPWQYMDESEGVVHEDRSLICWINLEVNWVQLVVYTVQRVCY